MAGWQTHGGQAVALDLESVDTDQLIPARFMATPRSQGYGGFLLHDFRFDADGSPADGFVLNRHPTASILVTRRNFGSGSSREAAVYALVDFGIRAVIAPSFGDIFAANAVNNGLLPARVADTDALIAALGDGVQSATIDIAASTVSVGAMTVSFALDASWRKKLVNGWDDIDLTQAYAPQIARFRAERARAAPWIFENEQTNR